MTSTTLLASLTRDVVQSPEMVVRNVLATAGGAVVGALAVAVLTLLASKLLRVRRVPRPAVMAVSALGAVAGAWLVWLWVTGLSGYGPGPGGAVVGLGTAKGSPSTATVPDTGATRRDPLDSLRIAIGRSKDYEPDSKRYYLVQDRPPARNLGETVQAIKDQRELNPALKTVEVVIYRDSIAETRGVVADLEEAVRPLGLTVKTHKPGTDAP